MFKSLFGCFNIIFLIMLFKVFAPGLAHLIIELFRTVLIVLNKIVGSMNTNPL